MRVSIPIICLAALLMVQVSCKQVENDYVYDVNTVDALPPNAGKIKEKSVEQYVSILHANLFQTAISPDELVEVSKVIQSIGDKELAHEVLISNFMNEADIIIPSDSVMRNDMDAFIDETYRRFLVREPTISEKTYFRNFLESNPNVTPEMVYFSFALSDEYLFY